ncbi:endolytic transglycosylase MltG [Candidatus Kaiserbacteria bacterium]|nr:endolytic transglycosylase MltG [Candidatus Kaiserbacteria bacterium]
MPDEPIKFSPELGFQAEQSQRTALAKFFKLTLALCALLLIALVCLYFLTISLNKAPKDFPINVPITITQGTGVKDITEMLEEQKVIRSNSLLYYTLIFFYEPTDIKASTYVFDQPLSTTEVAKRLTKGDFATDLIRFTHIEGERASQLAKRAEEVLPNFNAKNFLDKAEPQEGRLFPDTYFIPADFTHDELLELLLKTFAEKTASLQTLIEQQELTMDEILILASIIEREANTPESMKLVAGVLQNRLKTGMPLQADASIEYILEKPLSDLTPEDLEIESPYNTYLHTGLPPTPIGNPGLNAITAVLEPTLSEYYYYITDDEGEFYFAETYDRHLMNIERYLR